jgi:hypothetical protein
MAKDTPEITEAPRTPASELISKFISENNIELYTEELARKVRVISDGSIIIDKPGILARYIK